MHSEPNDWSSNAVLRRLQAKAKSCDAPVEAQLFLDAGVSAEQIEMVVKKAVATAAKDAGLPHSSISVGKPRKLSHSINVSAPVVVLRALLAREEFASLLPGDLTGSEAMIRPVER